MLKKMGFFKTPKDLRQVCIHPGQRRRTIFSPVDRTRIHHITRDKQSGKKVKWSEVTFFFFRCYLPVTVVEECQKKLRKLSSSGSEQM